MITITPNLVNTINLKPFQYTMTLHKMNETMISPLSTAFSRHLTEKFKECDQLNFTVPLYIQDTLTHTKIRNPQFDAIKPNQLVKLYKPNKVTNTNEWNIKLTLSSTSYDKVNISWDTTPIKYFKRITIVRANGGNTTINNISDGTIITSSTVVGVGTYTDTSVIPNTTYTYKAFVECLNDNTNNLVEVLGNTKVNVFASIDTGNTQYFVIDDIELDTDTKQIKTVSCYSREYLLSKKKLRKYTTTTKLHMNDNTGVLDKIADLTGWNIDYNIPDEFKNEYRTFSVDNSTVLDFLTNGLPESYGDNLVILFDTMNKTIQVRNLDIYGQNKGLVISYRNYMKSLKEGVKTDNLVTVLSCFGANDLMINAVNITGQNYLENYDYFKGSGQMSTDLVNALNAYDSYISTKTGIFSNYLSHLNGNTTYKYQGEVATYADITKKYQVADDNWLVVITKDETQSSQRTYYVYSNTSASWVYKGIWDITVTGLYNELSLKQENYDGINKDYKTIQGDMDDLMTNGLSSSPDYTTLVTQRNSKITSLATALSDLNNIKQQINAIQIGLNVTNVPTKNGSITLTIDGTFLVISVLTTDTTTSIASKIVTAINNSNNNNFFATSSSNTVSINYYINNKIASDITVTCADTSSTGLVVNVSSKINVGYMQQVHILQQQVDRLNYWTSQYGITKAKTLMSELIDFQYMDDYQNDNVTDANRLMTLGQKQLTKLSQPVVEYSADVISFTQTLQGYCDWDKLVLLDKVNVEYTEFGLQAELRLINIDLDIDNCTLNMEFSTIDRKIQGVLQQMQGSLNKALSSVDQVKVNVQDMKKSVETSNSNAEVLDNDWDCSKRNIKAGSNNNTSLNERGLLLIDKNNSDHQLLLENSGMFITTDNWQTVTEAVSAANGVKTNSILTDNGNNQKIMIGDYFKQNDGSAYMIQFLDASGTAQAKMYYVEDRQVLKIASLSSNASFEIPDGCTLFLGNYNSTTHTSNAFVDLMFGTLQHAVIQNCNIESSNVTVNSLALSNYINQVINGSIISSTSIIINNGSGTTYSLYNYIKGVANGSITA